MLREARVMHHVMLNSFWGSFFSGPQGYFFDPGHPQRYFSAPRCGPASPHAFSIPEVVFPTPLVRGFQPPKLLLRPPSHPHRGQKKKEGGGLGNLFDPRAEGGCCN